MGVQEGVRKMAGGVDSWQLTGKMADDRWPMAGEVDSWQLTVYRKKMAVGLKQFRDLPGLRDLAGLRRGDEINKKLP